MDNLKEEIKNEDFKDLYETYSRLISIIEELNNNIRELPEKEEI